MTDHPEQGLLLVEKSYRQSLPGGDFFAEDADQTVLFTHCLLNRCEIITRSHIYHQASMVDKEILRKLVVEISQI